MKNYSLNEIVYIDSSSLIFIIENNNLYTNNTVIITYAELVRRNLITTDLNVKLDIFCSANNIKDLKNSFENILEENRLSHNDWEEMGKNNAPIIEPKPIITSTESSESNSIINWKDARNGIIIFCVIHFVFEIATGNYKSLALPVIFNFIISRWFIRRQIEKGIKQNSSLLYGLMVSSVVFAIRLILGLTVTLIAIG